MLIKYCDIVKVVSCGNVGLMTSPKIGAFWDKR